MNAKKAKQLRAIARTTAIEHTAYLPMKPQRISAPMDVLWLGQCVLGPKCVRAQYKQLKREARP